MFSCDIASPSIPPGGYRVTATPIYARSTATVFPLMRLVQTRSRPRRRADDAVRIASATTPKVNGLLRADAAARAELYASALDLATGWMWREVRRLEDLEPERSAMPVPAAPAGCFHSRSRSCGRSKLRSGCTRVASEFPIGEAGARLDTPL